MAGKSPGPAPKTPKAEALRVSTKPKKTRAGSRPPKKDPAARPLTGLQTAFCAWYVSAEVNMNGTEAARRAGYKGNDRTLAAVASENLTKPNIRARIDELMDVALSGAGITVESVLRDLEVIKAKALATDQLASATRCAELEGRYLKMFTERIEHVQTIDEVSDEQLVRLIIELGEAAGVDLIAAIKGHGSQAGAVPGAAGVPTTH